MSKTLRIIPPVHNGHHVLSPSSAHRWWHCPGSIWAEEEARKNAIELPPNPAALEGTAAHEEAEQVLRGKLSHCVEYPQAQLYVDYVREILSDPLIEVALNYHSYLPDSGGTADALGVEGGVCHVIDLKYGMGKIEAVGNMQGKLYLLGALEVLGNIYEFDSMQFHIVQPRLDWIDVALYERTEIEEFGVKCRDFYRRITTSKTLEFQPGEATCRWCDAGGVCKPRADWVLSIAAGEFGKAVSDD